MKALLLTSLLTFATLLTQAQKPKDGTYTFAIAFTEWGGQSQGNTCTVIVKGNQVKVINNGTGTLKQFKGEVMDEGILMIHRTGKWIIGHDPKDKYAKQVGGCSGGPAEIDFKNKRFWIC